MARKNIEHSVGGSSRKKQQHQSMTKNLSDTYFESSGFKLADTKTVATQRLSPSFTPSSQGSSTRSSPGLLAGHYAGCKWTEPPSPSALPAPPQHWTQFAAFTTKCGSFVGAPSEITSHLKVLLKMQA